jgi:sialate O-acetylesterase
MQRFLLALALGLLCTARADVAVGKIFASNMVVQREVKAPFWGTAAPGEKVSVSASWGAKAETVADADGKWRVELDTPAAGGPFTITIKGNNTVELTNVLSGEVWLCSGQSNMQWNVKNSNNSAEEIANANYPEIRLFTVHCVASPTETEDLIRVSSWAPCSPETVPGFTAAGYFFGRKLHKDLGVPVGLINSSWGGTGVEAWTPWWGQKDDKVAQSIKANWDEKDAAYTPEKEQAWFEKQMEDYKAKLQKWTDGGKKGSAPRKPRKEGQPRNNRNYPTNLYNSMIHPIRTFAIKGAIWYQGEHNSGRGTHYEVMLTNLINSWRKDWGYDFPFYAVQLPNFMGTWKSPVEDGGWPGIREAFMKVAQNVPNTGMAITIDIGEAGNIHPRNKQDVGDRLARLALHDTYGKTGFAWSGPIPEKCEFKDGKAVVTFNTGGAPLAVRGGGDIVGFALTGLNGVPQRAKAVIQGDDTVVVSSPDVAEACLVHYAWANNPIDPEGPMGAVNLVNKEDLPATPFRFGSIPAFETFAKTLPEEAKQYELLYAFDPLQGKLTAGGMDFVYDVDNSAKLAGPFKKVAYYLALQDMQGKTTYAFVSMDPFDADAKKLGVPTKGSGARFQQKVTGVAIKTNSDAVAAGEFAEGCNIEFWDCNYGPGNKLGIEGASSEKFDFGDQMSPDKSPGYSCMQIHNYAQKQCVIVFNKFGSGKSCELGIGSCPDAGKNPDWTFTNSGQQVARAEFKVLVLR